MKKVAYYKGCLASLSAKELDTSTKALAPKIGLELVELESVTCCGAGDIHEAEPDFYLHLNARILSYASATGADTLLTVCNVCTLNLRQGELAARRRRRAARAREREPPLRWRARLRARRRRAASLWELAEEEGFERLKAVAHKGLKGLKIAPFYGCQILRRRASRLRRSRSALVARADHRGLRRRGDRLSGKAEVLRLPDHPGA